MIIGQILDQIYKLPNASKERLSKEVVEVNFPKGHTLIRADKVETNIYFINKGIVRAYTFQGDKEVTFWFGKEGDTALSMNSYVKLQKGYEDIELLEACALYELNSAKLKILFTKDIHIANWGRRLMEEELVKAEKRLISQQIDSASERYLALLKNDYELLQRVPLGCLASYLGITQASLSRIRAEIK